MSAGSEATDDESYSVARKRAPNSWKLETVEATVTGEHIRCEHRAYSCLISRVQKFSGVLLPNIILCPIFLQDLTYHQLQVSMRVDTYASADSSRFPYAYPLTMCT